MNKALKTSIYFPKINLRNSLILLFLLVNFKLSLNETKANNIKITNEEPESTTTFRSYTTIRNGYWNSPSTWQGGLVPNEYLGGDVVNINHMVTWNRGNDLYIQSGILNVSGVLTIPDANIKMENSAGVININHGLIKIIDDNLENKSGRINFIYGAVQLCNGNYTDESRHGTHGNGYIFSKNGNIENKGSGPFSAGIAWCIDNGGGVSLPTGENCGAARPPGGNCQNMTFFRTKLPMDEDCTNGIDDDGDGLADCTDSDCNSPQIHSVTPTHLTCPAGLNNGQITVVASGANLRYRLPTTSWQTQASFSNLGAGTYTVYVKNNITNCQIASSITLNPPSECDEDCIDGIDNDGDGLIDCNDPDCGNPSIININPTHLTCPSTIDNGQINIEASGANLLYRLQTTGWQSKHQFGQLASGTYTVFIINTITNCEVSASVTLNSASGCDEDCSNGIDDDGDGLVDCNDPNCGNPSIDNIDLIQPFCPSGENNGTITISASGENLFYRLHTTDWQSQSTFTNLIAGNYTVFIKNVLSSCEISTAVVLNPVGNCVEDCTNGIDDDGDGLIDCADPDCGQPIINTLTPTHLTCPTNTNNGTITVDATGSNLSYRLNNSNWQTSPIFTNLDAGNYTVFTRNETTGCEVSASITLNSATGCVEDCTNGIDDDGDGLVDCADPGCGQPIINTLTPTHLTCPANTNNGTIVVNASGSNLSYRLNTTSWQSNPTFLDLGAGDYTVYVRNAIVGCEISSSVTLNPAAGCVEDCTNGIDDDGDGLIDCADPDCGQPIINTLIPTHLTCPANTNNGTIIIDATGSNLSYRLNTTSWQSNPTFLGLGAGDYTVYVRNAIVGCEISMVISLNPAMDCIEDCANGIDDDGDGLIDCEDPDCEEHIICETGCVAYEGNITFDISNNYIAPDIITEYILTNTSGIIQQKSLTPTFINLSAGDYWVYIFNYSLMDGVTGNIIGGQISNLGDGCSMLSNGSPFRVCAELSCTTIAKDDAFSIICPGLAISGNVATNDTVSTSARFSIITPPINGRLDFDTINGDFIYTPVSYLHCEDITFTYRIFESDNCSNEASVTLSISDLTPPGLANIPTNITINCDEEIPYTDLATAYDNCPSISIDLIETSAQGEEGCTLYDYQITRTWTAIDICGNYSTEQQIIKIEDQTAPDIYRIYTLPNGKKMIAGVMENVTHRWKTIQLPIDFPSQPLIFTQLVSINEASLATVQLRNISLNQFELRLQEEEGNTGDHLGESVAWIAVEAGGAVGGFNSEIGKLTVGSNWTNYTFSETFSSNPSIFSSIQSTYEKDPVIPRYQNLSTNDIQLKIVEESSADPEVTHREERVAYWAIDQVGAMYNDKGQIIGEVGTISLEHGITILNTVHEYHNPVILANCLSANDVEPAMVRVRKLTNQSFELFLQEWDYQDDVHGTEIVSVMVIEGSIPLETFDFCLDGADSLVLGQDIIAVDNCDANIELLYYDTTYFTGPEKTTLRTWATVDECGNSTSYTQTAKCSGVSLLVKACLQGAIIDEDEVGLMRDDLRRKGLIPLTEPYSDLQNFKHEGAGGGEALDPALLTITGENAIVDWVFIELRAPDNPSTVLSTVSALLQRDGDVMSAKGDSMLTFENLPVGDYYVSIKHRNHLAMYTLYPQIFNASSTPFVDFTNLFTPVMGDYPGAEIDGIQALWSGDINGDAKTVYQGPTNDIFYIFLSVVVDEFNEQSLPNFITSGYTQKDFNLDGTVIYQGPNNDRSKLLISTTLSHPNNSTFLSNFILETGIERDSLIINPAWGEVDICEVDATNPACDFDQDGYINLIDQDDDNDGVSDADDIENFNPNSDSDADGISDVIETGNDGTYDEGIDSDPLSTCDPSPSSTHCIGFDEDGDGYFSNYPATHPQFDADDTEGCIPDLYNSACSCQDVDNDGTIIICHFPNGNIDNKKTKTININAWLAHKNHGDTCGPCETIETDCTNSIDDDGDGLIDCEDPDCGMPIIANIIPTDLSCPINTSNGQIEITATGTNLAYRLNTTNWQSNASFINLAAGTYIVFVKNIDTGCETSADITLNPASSCIEICDNGIDDDGDGLIDCEDGDCGKPAITNISPTDLSCPANIDNGQIAITATGINLAYRLHTTSWQSNASFINLAAGIYTVFVKNSNTGCEVSVDITLNPASNCTETDCTNGIDDDGDGLIDCEDPDCYLVVHTGAADFDGDGVGNYCDLDDDNDGILDIAEKSICVQTVYTLNPDITAAGASISPTGGTFNLVFDLTSGTAITEIGESFNVPVTISPMNNTATGASNTWTGEVISKPSSYINGTIVSVLPNTASFYAGLPSNNSTTEIPLASEFLDEIYNYMLINEQIDPLGTFSITIGAIPSAPSASLLSDSIQLSSAYNADRALSGRWLAGYYARLDIQNDLYLEIGNVAATAPKTVRFGETYTYNYTAFSYNSGTGPTNSNFRGLITIINSSITFCTQQDTEEIQDTDSDGMPNHLDLDADGDGCYDKIEADVPGATTDGSETDSLIITEVGANGLADAIESDDTQAATTSYTIPQTQSGVNDFQNSLIATCDDDASNNNPVKILAQNTVTASGSGANGLPSLTLNVPEGSNENRAILLYYMAERDHRADGTPNTYGDNWVIKDPSIGHDYNHANQSNIYTISGSGSTISGLYYHIADRYSFSQNTRNYADDAKFSTEYLMVYLLENELDALLPSGSGNITIDFDLLGVNLPKSTQDEMVLGAFILDNVVQGTGTSNPFAVFARERNYYVSSTESPFTTTVNNDLTPESDLDGVIMLGLAANAGLTNGSNYGFHPVAGLDVLADGQLINNTPPLNRYTTSSEADGFTYSVQFGEAKNINIGNQISVSTYNGTENEIFSILFTYLKVVAINN